ncbi:DUF4339 domain-containing protein [Planctomycetota bacterium]
MWYLPSESSQYIGPYSTLQIQGFIANGAIMDSTLCWCKGMLNWQPLDQVKPFTELFRPQKDVIRWSLQHLVVLALVLVCLMSISVVCYFLLREETQSAQSVTNVAAEPKIKTVTASAPQLSAGMNVIDHARNQMMDWFQENEHPKKSREAEVSCRVQDSHIAANLEGSSHAVAPSPKPLLTPPPQTAPKAQPRPTRSGRFPVVSKKTKPLISPRITDLVELKQALSDPQTDIIWVAIPKHRCDRKTIGQMRHWVVQDKTLWIRLFGMVCQDVLRRRSYPLSVVSMGLS